MATTSGSPWDPTVSLGWATRRSFSSSGVAAGRGRPLPHAPIGLAFETFPMSRLLHFAAVSFPQYTREALLLFEHFTARTNLYNMMLSALSSWQSRWVALYRSMLASSASPDEQTFLSLLKCVKCASVGKQVHAHVLMNGLHSRVYLRNSLIKMYLDAGDVEVAEAMFRCAPTSDTVSCNIMLSGYVKEGCSSKALQLFLDMASREICVDQYTAVALLACCGRLKNPLLARSVHGVVVRRMDMVDRGLILSNALLDTYAKCGEMNTAMSVFGEAGEEDTMVAGFAKVGMLDLASNFFFEAPCRDLIVRL